MPTIMDLPDRILQNILIYIPENFNVNLSRVCKRFCHLIESYYGKVLILGVPTTSMKKNLPSYKWTSPEELKIICHTGVRCCRVGKLLDPTKGPSSLCRFLYVLRDVVLLKDNQLALKHPNLLRKLQFEGRISPNYFKVLTTMVDNLKSLSLHWKALSSLNPDVLDPLYFPNLQILDIWGGHDIKENSKVNFEKLCKFVENFSVLLKNVFLSLRVLRIDLPNEPKLLMLITSLMLAFIHRHAETLLIFKFELIPMEIWRDVEINSMEWIKCSPDLYKMQSLSSKLRLKTLELITHNSKNDEVSYLSLWIILAMGIKSLKEFQVPGLPIGLETTRHIISNNSQTINLVHLCVPLMESGIWKPIDCSIFSDCPVLTQLFLEGAVYSKRRIRKAGIVNIKYLPVSLKTLSITRIPALTASLEPIFDDLEHLQSLRLIGVGNKSEFGVTIRFLNSILSSKKLQALCISFDSIRQNLEKENSVPIPSIFLKLCPQADEYPEDYIKTHKDDIVELRLLCDSKSYEVVNYL